MMTILLISVPDKEFEQNSPKLHRKPKKKPALKNKSRKKKEDGGIRNGENSPDTGINSYELRISYIPRARSTMGAIFTWGRTSSRLCPVKAEPRSQRGTRRSISISPPWSFSAPMP